MKKQLTLLALILLSVTAKAQTTKLGDDSRTVFYPEMQDYTTTGEEARYDTEKVVMLIGDNTTIIHSPIPCLDIKHK